MQDLAEEQPGALVLIGERRPACSSRRSAAIHEDHAIGDLAQSPFPCVTQSMVMPPSASETIVSSTLTISGRAPRSARRTA